MDVDTVALSARWAAAWGDCRPLSYELRSCLEDRWVRFHSLPGSKRYAGDEREHAEVLRRHQVVLGGLLWHEPGDGGEEILVVSASWSASPEPANRDPGLTSVMPAAYWTSVLTDASIPGDEIWTHLWASASRLPGDDLTRLLRLAADDETAGVIITSAAMSWLYAPCDGGADVIAATSQHRDELRHRHQHWLSAHPAGL